MKQSQAWKNLERETARYFGTKRRLRGADFSASDVEIIVDVDKWLKRDAIYYDQRLVVECKYRSEIGVVPLYNKYRALHPDAVTIVILGDYLLVDLEYFELVWNDIIEAPLKTPNELLQSYAIHNPSREPAEYLGKYLSQCKDYITDIEAGDTEDDALYFPILCLAKKNIKGRIVVCHLEDITYIQEVIDEIVNH